MKKIVTVIFVLSVSLNSFAQNLDSLYQHYISLHQKNTNIKELSLQTVNAPVKCGFGTVMEIKANFDQFTVEQQQSLRKVMSRPGKQTSIVSPSGYFRIHFDTTGTEIPIYFSDPGKTEKELIDMSIDSLAVALDYSYNYEVNILGYLKPPSDGTDGGDGKYDVYVEPYGGYGETRWDGPDNAAYMVIDNRLDNTYEKGIRAAKVTAAHEFHHGIQVGNYSDDISQLFIFEMTSTSMEEFVYDEVNDYYNYLSDYFRHPEQRLDNTAGGGYDICIWNIFLVEKFNREKDDAMFGQKLIRRAWEIFKEKGSAIKAIEDALAEEGLSFKELFNEFGIWCYYTGIKSDPEIYFEEGINYPVIKPINTYSYIGNKQTYKINSNAVSNNFIRVVTQSGDTLMSIVTNSDVISIANGSNNRIAFDLTLNSSGSDGAVSITNELYVSVSSTDNSLLKSNYIFRDNIVDGPANSEEIGYAFPQPFSYANNENVFIPAISSITDKTELKIYTVSMNLVYSDDSPEFGSFDFDVVKWNGKNNDGKKLATGVYIYVTKSGDNIKTGKLVIYND
ncbi:MAG: hypothetical protein JEY94_04485 [Melioribacteraceae bacterium]|nr:hypothetical protein [Melioribacteraceae bacterium]